MNITRYASDEDNDTTDLKYSFKIASTIPANIGYPIAKIGFLSSFGSEYKKSMINQLVDEFPASTIIQKNNTFLVYSANVEEFKDPIKVDSLSTKGVKDKSIDSLFTWITPTDTTSADTNYYTESEMMVEFSVIDPEGLIGKDTINFFINPKNDKPVWSGVRDTLIKKKSMFLQLPQLQKHFSELKLHINIKVKLAKIQLRLNLSHYGLTMKIVSHAKVYGIH